MGRYYTFRHFIIPLLDNCPTLDLGCGTGEFLKWCPIGSIGIDISNDFLKICENKGLKCIYSDLNQSLPFESASFSRVLLIHTLEHIENPINLLREINRILNKEGKVIIALPRESTFLELFDKYFIDHPYHLYSFSLRNIKHLLKRAGFIVERIFYDLPKIFEILTPLVNALPSWLAINICFSYWIVASKKTDDLSYIETIMGNEMLAKNWENNKK